MLLSKMGIIGQFPLSSKKNDNIPLYLKNYAIFLSPPIFTNNIYTYILRYMMYLGEPSGNIIKNYHCTFIEIFMHGYDPSLKKINPFPGQC